MSYHSNKRDDSVPEFVTTEILYGLQFFDELQDLIDYDKPLTCIPNITLVNSNTQAILDYTTCTGEENLEFLGNILNTLVAGDGITLANCKHIDDLKGEEKVFLNILILCIQTKM